MAGVHQTKRWHYLSYVRDKGSSYDEWQYVKASPENPITQIIFRDTEMTNGSIFVQMLLCDVNPAISGYSPYKGEFFDVNVDGTVSGMTSLSPNMTILTDNPGVNIEATYNMDTKKVYRQEVCRASICNRHKCLRRKPNVQCF